MPSLTLFSCDFSADYQRNVRFSRPRERSCSDLVLRTQVGTCIFLRPGAYQDICRTPRTRSSHTFDTEHNNRDLHGPDGLSNIFYVFYLAVTTLEPTTTKLVGGSMIPCGGTDR